MNLHFMMILNEGTMLDKKNIQFVALDLMGMRLAAIKCQIIFFSPTKWKLLRRKVSTPWVIVFRQKNNLNINFILKDIGTSLVVQWLRIHLLMQGMWVQSLVQEDPTCRGTTKPVHHNY